MARTTQDIQNSIVADLSNPILNPELVGTDFQSGTNLVGLLIYVFAYAGYILESLFDISLQNLEYKKQALYYGSTRWYRDRALEFQYGDSLVWLNNAYIYNPITPANRIITQCSVRELPTGRLRLKTAKSNLTPLNALELSAFTAYMQKVKVAGTFLEISSSPADIINAKYDIFYNAQYNPTTVKNNVNTAIETFLTTLPFDAEFSIIAFEDALQRTTGVINFRRNGITYAYGLLAAQPINVSYITNAGYATIDPNSDILNISNYYPI